MKTHTNIPVFIVHEGCPHMCVFCSQREISGAPAAETEPLRVRETIESFLARGRRERTEIAFFGGSFTGIGTERMTALLKIADEYVRSGAVDGIRLSTRPDYIDDERLDILEEYGVTAIELGIQSMDDAVLPACERGHTAEDTRPAAHLIKRRGCFELVGQMMTGLPGGTPENELYTAKELVRCGCDCARIYPTVVIPGTRLEQMLLNGEYELADERSTITRCAAVLRVFLENSVKVIRIGLQDVESVRGCLGYDSAIGERVWSRLYLENVRAGLRGRKKVVLKVAPRFMSRLTGQHRENLTLLREEDGVEYIKLGTDTSLGEGEVKVLSL